MGLVPVLSFVEFLHLFSKSLGVRGTYRWSNIFTDRVHDSQALEKAKEAGRKERAAVKLREQLGLIDQVNLDLTFNVQSI